jgi:type IV secretory pathway VirB9-like protein
MQLRKTIFVLAVIAVTSSISGCTSFIKWINDEDNARVLSDEVKTRNYFKYEVFGTDKYVQVFDDGSNTTIILPKRAKVNKAWLITKHGRISQPVVQQGPYWIVQSIGNQWKIESSVGDFTLQRVDLLPDNVIIQTDKRYVDRLKNEIYDLMNQLAEIKKLKQNAQGTN